jgi:hypothetical protein
MTMKEKEVLAQQLRKVSGDIAEIALFLEGDESQTQTAPTEIAGQPEKPGAKKTATYQETRAVMGEKARTGYRAEVKAILAKHNLAQLSDCKDPSVFAEIIAETEAIGNA